MAQQIFDIFEIAEELPTDARFNLAKLGKLYIKKTRTAYSDIYLQELFGFDQPQWEEVAKAWVKAGFISRRRNGFLAINLRLSILERNILQLID